MRLHQSHLDVRATRNNEESMAYWYQYVTKRSDLLSSATSPLKDEQHVLRSRLWEPVLSAWQQATCSKELVFEAKRPTRRNSRGKVRKIRRISDWEDYLLGKALR